MLCYFFKILQIYSSRCIEHRYLKVAVETKEYGLDVICFLFQLCCSRTSDISSRFSVTRRFALRCR